MSALNNRENAISISSILYPNDSTYNGKELRLKQQFFFVSATIQDVIASYKRTGRSWTEFPDYVSYLLSSTFTSSTPSNSTTRIQLSRFPN